MTEQGATIVNYVDLLSDTERTLYLERVWDANRWKVIYELYQRQNYVTSPDDPYYNDFLASQIAAWVEEIQGDTIDAALNQAMLIKLLGLTEQEVFYIAALEFCRPGFHGDLPSNFLDLQSLVRQLPTLLSTKLHLNDDETDNRKRALYARSVALSRLNYGQKTNAPDPGSQRLFPALGKHVMLKAVAHNARALGDIIDRMLDRVKA